MTGQHYTKSWRRAVRAGVEESAAALVPTIIDTLGQTPQTVIDVGAGEGWFLAEFERAGVTSTVGVEGSWATNESGSQARYVTADLSTADLPRDLGRFDLAISLEVAEHLPPRSAETFIDWLTSLADVIVFSAAVPGQGGPGHVNERWPTYWADLFALHGFETSGLLRRLIWNDDSISWWYRQNVMIAHKPGVLGHAPVPIADVVHPDMWRHHGLAR